MRARSEYFDGRTGRFRQGGYGTDGSAATAWEIGSGPAAAMPVGHDPSQQGTLATGQGTGAKRKSRCSLVGFGTTDFVQSQRAPSGGTGTGGTRRLPKRRFLAMQKLLLSSNSGPVRGKIINLKEVYLNDWNSKSSKRVRFSSTARMDI